MEVSVSYLLRSVYLENTNIYDRGLFLDAPTMVRITHTALIHETIRYHK